MEPSLLIAAAFAVAAAGASLGWFLHGRAGKHRISRAEEKAGRILAEAEKAAETASKQLAHEGKEEWSRKKAELERDAASRRSKLQTFEQQLVTREDNLEQKVELIGKKEQEIQDLKSGLQERISRADQKTEKYDKLLREENQRLERIAGMSATEAKRCLVENLLEEARMEAAQRLKEIRDNSKSEARKEAQKIVVQAIQRSAVDHCVESTVSVLHIENEEMKGRIIGKEGRNIRAFEAATGVDVIVDDTPEAVIISGFDALRREIARLSLERLLSDGRIHPARIEEVVEKVRAELDEELLHVGENALLEGGMHGGRPELIRHIGMMKYRSSFGQNLLSHSLEVAHLAGLMAGEMGFDVNHARRGGLLHDIGKTLDRSIEGPHAVIGMEFAKKNGEQPVVLNAIGAHHDDIAMDHPISVLVQAADAISGARPGARRENIEAYAKRLERLESLASSFDGVAKTYAIQAGREIRVIVEHDKIDDVHSDLLANDIAKKIQAEMQYPGQVKVTVIRETRAVAYAK